MCAQPAAYTSVALYAFPSAAAVLPARVTLLQVCDRVQHAANIHCHFGYVPSLSGHLSTCALHVLAVTNFPLGADVALFCASFYVVIPGLK